jgi:ubiquinone/menaquinone biosynthesis C-methylase UbiE
MRRLTGKDYSDELAAAQMRRYDEGHRGVKVTEVRKQLTSIRGKLLLDLGCGPGVFSNLCSELGASVVGMDFSEAMLSIARQRYGSGFSMIQSDAKLLPFRDKVFDMVIALDVIEHLYEPEAVLGEVQRVIKPHVIILVTTPKVGFSIEYFLTPKAILMRAFANLPATVQQFIRKKVIVNLPLMTQNLVQRMPSSQKYLNTHVKLHVKLYNLSELVKLARDNGFRLEYGDTFPNRRSFGITGHFIEFLFVGPLRKYKWRSAIYRFRREGL